MYPSVLSRDDRIWGADGMPMSLRSDEFVAELLKSAFLATTLA
jgi:hypothetical protein